MKIYKLQLSNRELFYLPEEKLDALMKNKEQIVKVNLENEWVLINKAHVISARVDVEETRRIAKQNKPALPKYEQTDAENVKRMLETKKKLKQIGLLKT